MIAIKTPRFFSYYFFSHYLFVFLSIVCNVFTTKTISLVFFTLSTMFYSDGNTFLTTLFNDFVVIEWFDVNSSSTSLFEILSIKKFLADFFISLCISFIALKMLKFSYSALILINTKLRSSFSIALYVFIS